MMTMTTMMMTISCWAIPDCLRVSCLGDNGEESRSKQTIIHKVETTILWSSWWWFWQYGGNQKRGSFWEFVPSWLPKLLNWPRWLVIICQPRFTPSHRTEISTQCLETFAHYCKVWQIVGAVIQQPKQHARNVRMFGLPARSPGLTNPIWSYSIIPLAGNYFRCKHNYLTLQGATKANLNQTYNRIFQVSWSEKLMKK